MCGPCGGAIARSGELTLFFPSSALSRTAAAMRCCHGLHSMESGGSQTGFFFPRSLVL